MSKNKSFIAGSSMELILFSVFTLFINERENMWTCPDCSKTFGFPFTAVSHGGFITHTNVLWLGLFADILIAVLFSVVTGLFFRFVWSKLLSIKLK